MLTCIIIEDQPPAQRILRKFIEDLGTLELKEVFPEVTQAMDFLKVNQVDLIFLDIHLPKISGIEFLRMLPQRPSVILTTAFSEYAIESYELNVVDYLLKPFSYQRFVQAVSKVKPAESSGVKTAESERRGEVFIKSGYDHVRVEIDDILYIKSDADYTEIHLEGVRHISSEPLRYWLEFLDDQQFTRLHKSYVVNTSRIVRVSGNQAFLTNGDAVPIGRAYKEEFSSRFLK